MRNVSRFGAAWALAQLAQAAALNAFAMAIEGSQAGVDDPLADALLTHALRVLAEWLPRLRTSPEDAEPRLRLMVGALLSGQGSDYSGGGLAQALAHAVGPRSSTSNGVVEAMLLPHTMRHNAPVTAAGLARIADALGASGGNDAIDAVERLLGSAEVPRRLRDVGVGQDALIEAVEHTMGDWWITRAPRPGDLKELLLAAW